MSAAADRPILLRLGTRVAVLGSLLVIAVWLAAAWGWMHERQEQLDGAPAERTAAAAAAVQSALRLRLESPPLALDQALAAARIQAAEWEALRETRRGRKLVDEPELEELVRIQLDRALKDLGAVKAAWLRTGSRIDWGPRWRPRLDGEGPIDGPCLLQQAGFVQLARCRELRLDEGSGSIAGAARLVGVPALLSSLPGPVEWGLFVADEGGQTLAVQLWSWPEGDADRALLDPVSRQGFEQLAESRGWGRRSVELERYGARLIVSTAPAHRLSLSELLLGEAGPITQQWRRWALRTGAVAVAALAFFCFLGWRINAAFRPIVSAARGLGADDLEVRVPVRRSDEIGAIAAVLNDLGTSLKHARGNWEREAKLAAWRDVARGLAHEIKNPLTPIRGTVENLLRWKQEEPERFDEKVEARLGTILEEVDQLSRLASAFSDFAKLPPPQKDAADLNALLQGVAELQLGDRSSLKLDERLDAALGPVSLDAGQIRQVATNLMKNAREALGSEGGTVRLESGPHGAGAWFAVSDDGPGVDEGSLESLFVPGWSTRKHEGGSGLGLWLCHRIVLEHGGGIEASRSELGGLRIRVTLPEG